MCKVKVIAEGHGHSILLLPPYRPELNAIEMAWGIVKNFVARKNCPDVRFTDLLPIIEAGVKQATLHTWVKLDRKIVEEKTQLEALEKEEARLAEFREQHPDLVFSLNDDSDSDDGNISLNCYLFSGMQGSFSI